MKKTLVYHFYASSDYMENVANRLHFLLLDKYIHVFDDCRIYISVDDTENRELIRDVESKFIGLNGINDVSFKVIKNDAFREVQTFKLGVIDQLRNLDSLVFFAHNKGTVNVTDGKFNNTSILKWIYGMYFYNFEYIDEMENILVSDSDGFINTFYGTFLVSDDTRGFAKTGCWYTGTFYWINAPKLAKRTNYGMSPECIISDRCSAERFPGELFEWAYGAGGLSSHNYKSLYTETSDFYFMPDDIMNEIIGFLGDSDRFLSGFEDTIKEII